MLVDPGWWRDAVAGSDPAAWQQAWHELDLLFERLAGGGHGIDRLVLTGERDLIEITPQLGDRWALWRRRELADLLAGSR